MNTQETCLLLADLPRNNVIKICEIGPLRGAPRPIDEAALASIVRQADDPIPVYMMEATMLNVSADSRNAAGWITSLETRDNGTSLWAGVDWADVGRRRASGRYIVPCINFRSIPGFGPMGARLSMVILVLKPAGRFQYQPIDAAEVSMRMRDAQRAISYKAEVDREEADAKATYQKEVDLRDRLIKGGMSFEDAMVAANNCMRLGVTDDQ